MKLSSVDSLPPKSLAIVCAIFFFCAWLAWSSVPKFWGSSEAREAHIMQSMLRDHNWLVPTRNGIVASKPPLHHWIGSVIAEAMGGVSEFTSRIPSVFAATIVVGITIYFAAMISGEGVLAFLILSTLYGFAHSASDAMVDMTFCMFTLLSTFALIGKHLKSSLVEPSWWYWALFSALAVLTKGPLGFVLPYLLASVYFLTIIGLRPTLRLLYVPRLAHVFCLILGISWYLTLALQAQNEFLGRQLWFENLQRFFGGENVNREPFWFYVPSFLLKAFPWSLAFLVVLYRDLRTGLNSRNDPERQKRVALSAAVAVAILLFSISAGKRHSYLLPLFPLMSLVVVSGMRSAKYFTGTKYVMIFGFCLLSALVAGAYLNLMPDKAEGYMQSFLFLHGSLIAGSLLIIAAAALSRHRFWLACSATLLLAMASNSALWMKAYLKDYAGQAEKISTQIDGCPVEVIRTRYDESLDAILYYLDRSVKITDPSALHLVPETLYISSAVVFDWLKDAGAKQLTITTGRERNPSKQSNIGSVVVSYVGDTFCHHE